ncbi:MAG TPA: class I SAM-dependent methyltransferase [Anaerolineales bacterium]
MDANTALKLLALNQRFYQNFAHQFSKTRQRLQPGVQKILQTIPPGSKILDLGCGNGELARALGRKGHHGAYVGVDFSPVLLTEASRITPGRLPAQFILADLAAPGWEANLPVSTFDLVLAFAVLHHIPGAYNRREILHRAHALLVPEGRLIHSEWQFLNSPRLVARIQPWEMAGLSAHDVDPGDYLLDWRRGGLGFRYVHSFSQAELGELAAETGFLIVETFDADGETGNLGLYQVWKRV